MTHQPTQLLSRIGSGPVGVCVIGLRLDFFLHSSLIPDSLVGSRPPYDSTVELGWLMCHGLNRTRVTVYDTWNADFGYVTCDVAVEERRD